MSTLNKCNNCTNTLKCGHKFCSHAFMNGYKNEKSDLYKCGKEGCSSELFDYEIRKGLSDDEYKDFEKKLKSNPKLQRPKCGWICAACTFINLPYLKFCFVCQSNGPEDFYLPSYYELTDEENKLKELEIKHEKNEEERIEKEKEEMQERLKKLKELTKQEVAFTTEVSECPICMMDYEAGEAIILHSCLHTICRDCFKNYLLNTGDPKIKCPTENCIGLIEDREIIAMLSEAEFEKYQQLSLRAAEATVEFSFHCKGTNCTAWIVHDELLKSFKCPLCKKENCIKCGAIHEGLDCRSYQRSLSNQTISADSLYFETLLKSGEAMLCSGCKNFIEKVKGCDWIRCRMCRTELCWATKGPRWGPKGHGDISGGCRCKVDKKKCHPSCHYCH